MHFELSDDQRAVMASVVTVLDRHAGPGRARDLGGDDPAYDAELEAALDAGGFLDLAGDHDAGPLGAALVVEATARAAGVVGVAARALVAPAIGLHEVASPVVLAVDGAEVPVRFGTAAATAVVLGDDEVRVVAVDAGDVTPLRTRYGYPFASMRLGAGQPVDIVPARVRDWWRVALAVELAGTMAAALEVTVDYVRERQQFGRPIGSFQAIQHRLAECAVGAQASRWMALEAAWRGAPAEAAASALSYALGAADRIFTETHQCTGAIGFTTEYDLHLWTMRIPALRAEAELLGSPGVAVAAERWGKVAS